MRIPVYERCFAIRFLAANISLSLLFLLSIARGQSDHTVRSSAYKAGSEQAEIHTTSGELLVELDAILADMARNGVSDDSRATAQAVRASLTSTREGSIAAALSNLREISTSGRYEGIRGVIKNQQEAEISMRRIAAMVSEKQFSKEIVASFAAILSRQERAMLSTPTVKNETAVAAEQQAIALQVRDMVNELASTPADLPASVAAVIKQASEKAASLDLAAKAENAAGAGAGGDIKAKQKELQAAMGEVSEVLNRLVPPRDRLEQAAKDLAKLQKEQAALAVNKQPDPTQSAALATTANAISRQVASESPTAEKALNQAVAALQSPLAPAQADAKKALAAAAAAIEAQLAVEESAESASVAQTAQSLQQMAAQAAALAAAQSSPAADQAAIASQTELLQSQAAPVAPEAAASLAEARKEMNSGKSAEAAASLQKSAQQLAAHAASAQAVAGEDARLDAIQSAIEKAVEANQSVGQSMQSGNRNEAASKALHMQAQMDRLALQAASAASQSSQDGSAQATSQAAKASAKAAASSRQTVESAAGGNLLGAQEANSQTAQNLAAASQALAKRQNELRDQAGLPSSSASSADSSNSSSSIANGGEGQGQTMDSVSGTTSGPAGSPQRGFTPTVRQAMAELRKTPVPPEFSGPVQDYFQVLAGK